MSLSVGSSIFAGRLTMKTPKEPKRFSSRKKQTNAKPRSHPDGRYTGSITDASLAAALGQVITQWAHLEDRMIIVMHDLISDEPNLPARQIFRAIINQQARIKVLRALLQRSRRNKGKSADFDAVIDEFSAINDLRNSFLHGLWYTHESGRTFLSEASTEDFHFLEKREVKIEDVWAVTERMNALWDRIGALPRKSRPGPPIAYIEISPPPPDEETP